MKILCGIVYYGHGKQYVYPQFINMMNRCMVMDDVKFAWATDHDPPLPGMSPCDYVIPMGPGHVYVEDMLIDGRDKIRQIGLDEGFDKVLYQGIDCLWQSREDFLAVASHDVPVVSALTSARSDSNYAVARRFKLDEHYIAEPDELAPITLEQEDISDDELNRGGLIRSGFPGADAIFFRNDTLQYDWGDHDPWYIRQARGGVNVDCMEYTCYKLITLGKRCYVDADRKVWHVHEDGIARMWKGIEKPLNDLSWPT